MATSDVNLTEDDFEFQYVKTRGWPKLVHWVTSAPLTYGDMQVTVMVLQRQMTEDDYEEFIVTLKPTSKGLSASDDSFGTDPFTEDEGMLLGSCPTFEDACDLAIDGVRELRYKHSL